jgi:hypothetical protein
MVATNPPAKAMGWGDVHGRHQRYSKRRMRAWDSIEDVPGSAIRQLDVEDHYLDLTISQTANGVGYSR